MPQPQTQKSSRKAGRRAEIIQAARQRFRASGLAESTMDMVAEDVGIARPNLYRYFKDKTELVGAVLVEEAFAINDFRATKLKGITKFADRVVRTFQATVEVMEADPLWADIIAPTNVPYTAYVAASDPRVLESNRQYWTPIFTDAEANGELRPGLDHEELLTWLLGVEFMFMERSEIFPTLEDVERYTRTYVLPALLTNGTNR
ncbi:MAG: TetR/AcrR family transcriptional regulator [Alphaproteobacteria bacterium]